METLVERCTCACHTSPPSMLIRADDPIRKHAHRRVSGGAEFSFRSLAVYAVTGARVRPCSCPCPCPCRSTGTGIYLAASEQSSSPATVHAHALAQTFQPHKARQPNRNGITICSLGTINSGDRLLLPDDKHGVVVVYVPRVQPIRSARTSVYIQRLYNHLSRSVPT